MRGFFSDAEVAQPKAYRTPQCGACGLHKGCQSPKMKPSGSGKRSVMIIGEAPGKNEDRENLQFVGGSGRFLEGALRRVGVRMRDCILHNAIVCRPPKNRDPTPQEIAYCRPNLTRALAEYQPTVIITVGAHATQTVVQDAWRGDAVTIGKWAGWRIPDQLSNTWICPTYHPAFVIREDSRVLTDLFTNHLAQAVKKTARPWKQPPDWKREVQCVRNPNQAAAHIERFRKRGKPIAFDLETDRLKPDHKDAAIITCAISDGKTTVAFGWYGAVIPAMKKLLTSGVPKIAANLKFEDRWIAKVLRVRVRNWIWDTMQAAHIFDLRRGITGLDFLSYVMLGQPDYSSDIKKYFSADNNNSSNQIRKADMGALLLYNGLDALLEYKIAQKQMQHAGLTFNWRKENGPS